MKKVFVFGVLVLATLMGCSKDPKSYTVAEWDALNKEDKQTKMRQLNGEETALLMRGMMRKAFSGESFDSTKVTIGDLIEEGRKGTDSTK
jgi:hypothetical protein